MKSVKGLFETGYGLDRISLVLDKVWLGSAQFCAKLAWIWIGSLQDQLGIGEGVDRIC